MSRRNGCVRGLALAAVLAGGAPWWAGANALAQGSAATGSAARPVAPAVDSAGGVPALAALTGRPASALRDVVQRFSTDRAALFRRYDTDYSPERRARFRAFYGGWREQLRATAFDSLDHEARIDWLLLDNLLRYELELLAREERLFGEMAPVAPFAPVLLGLLDARRRLEAVDAPAVARTLTAVDGEVARLKRALDTASPAAAATRGTTPRPSRIVAYRTATMLEELRRGLERWQRYYAGYDPVFTWWVAEPHRKADQALRDYVKFLRERIVGHREGEDEPIVGDPIGAGGLAADLAHEMLPYTPTELIAIGERELAWCEAEMRKAARDMGFGDDWRAALEKVKTLHVEPGRQPELIRDLAREAIEFVESRNLLTVPPLAKEVWRMEMLSPEAQKVSPFFLGGEVIQVSFPTDRMGHEDKLMSMRGNNRYFSRATVQHELIPGHHLQGFMTDRYNPHRDAFATPFWTEGWALYWEMLLWDLGFPRTPEERVGMLFWRSHRAARIIFSLRFHMGTMTPAQAIDFLVDRVGHERANATAEVRRSFNGTYSPLYQVAYMMGGLQFRALHRALVGGGRMTDRAFHDAILQGGNMPVEMVRARLLGQPLGRDFVARWKFAD